MRDELEKALGDKFPFMRRGLSAEEQKDRYGGVRDLYSAWGLAMDDGWFRLIWNMCTEITEAYQAAGEPIDIVVDQAKEKWGTLRFYWRPQGQEIMFHGFDFLGGPSMRVRPGFSEVHQKVGEIVSKYEKQSAHVCEVCGAPGSLRTDLGRVQTLCEEHYQDLRAKREQARREREKLRQAFIEGKKQRHDPT